MTISKLYTDILDNIVQAQYNAYVFSQTLGEQVKDNLFPIPIAEIREITLDVNFAYVPPDHEADAEMEIVLPELYNSLKPLLAQVFSKIRKSVVDEIDLSDYSGNAGWLEVKRNLMQGTLDQYTLTAMKQQFFSEAKKITRHNSLDQSQLVQLITKVAEDTIVHHPDVKKFLRGLPVMSLVKETIEEEFKSKREELQHALEEAKRKKIPGLNIIVDAGELKELPPDAIQHARVVLDVRTILNEKEQQP